MQIPTDRLSRRIRVGEGGSGTVMYIKARDQAGYAQWCREQLMKIAVAKLTGDDLVAFAAIVTSQMRSSRDEP